MNTYDYLNEIELKKLYSNENNADILSELKLISDDLKKLLLQDFEKIIKAPKNIELTAIEYENPDYRQSATAIILTLKFINEGSFQLYIEILIEYQKILIGTKGNPKSELLERFKSKIESNYNNELKIHLKEIQ